MIGNLVSKVTISFLRYIQYIILFNIFTPMKFSLAIFIFLVLCNNNVFSQNLLHNYANLSNSEKSWIIKHPFVAKKTHNVTQKVIKICTEVKIEQMLDQENIGGKLDAFRHAYWMAVLTQKIGKRKSKKLGLAHEKGNRILFDKNLTEDGETPDSISCAMDLFNNEQGIRIGQANKKANSVDIKLIVIKKIQEGAMKIIAKNSTGQFVDCNDKEIPLPEIQKKWKNSKCLVSSNYNPH